MIIVINLNLVMHWGHHMEDGMLGSFFSDENCRILIEISQKFVNQQWACISSNDGLVLNQP